MQDRESTLVFLEPGLKKIMKLNLVKKSTQWICCGLRPFTVLTYSRFLWSMKLLNGWTLPSSQWCHSPKVSLTGRSSWFLHNLWGRSFSDCSYLLTNIIPQKWDGRNVELTFFTLYLKLVLKEMALHLFDMDDMAFQDRRVKYYVIYVSNHKFSEDIISKTLEH